MLPNTKVNPRMGEILPKHIHRERTWVLELITHAAAALKLFDPKHLVCRTYANLSSPLILLTVRSITYGFRVLFGFTVIILMLKENSFSQFSTLILMLMLS